MSIRAGKCSLILVVASCANAREELAETLRREGYAVLETSSVDEASAQLSRKKVAAVFWMPGNENGAIKDGAFLRDRAASRLSMFVMIAQARQAPEIEADCFLEAPVSRSNLLTFVSLLLREQAGRTPPKLVDIAQDMTDQVRAKEALRQSEERFRAVFDRSAIGIVLVSLEGRPFQLNSACENILGYTSSELCQMRFTEFTYPDDIEKDLTLFLDLIDGKRDSYQLEKRYFHKDGHLVWGSLAVSLVHQADGSPSFAVAILVDITERVRAQEALRQSEERFHLAVRGSKAGLWDWNVVTGECYYAPRIKELLGYCEDEFSNTLDAFTDALHPEDRDSVLTAIDNHLTRHVPYDIDCRLRQRSGEYIWLNSRGQALWDDKGRAYRMAGSIIDISERQAATERIAEQAALLDKAQDAILVRDFAGKVLFWNRSAERMFGVPREEAVGASVQELVSSDWEKHSEAQCILQAKGDWSGEFAITTRAGAQMILEARWTLLRDRGGKPKSVLSINTDVTEKRKIEAQFLRAQRMESIGTLAGGIAHDLNNVLSPILASIEYLKTDVSSEEAQQVLETIETSAQRGADLVRQVLLFARGVEGHHVEVRPETLVKDVECIVKDTFPKSIRFHAEVPAGAWNVVGDPTQLHQILLNLCVNARDAMPGGGAVTITAENHLLNAERARLHPGATEGAYVVFGVQDTGCGIPAELQDKIFEPFFTTKEQGQGTGLGLSTVAAITKSHGGFIEIHSQTGTGTIFSIYLPAKKVAAGRLTSSTAKDIERGQGELVLIIDDEIAILNIARKILETFGYRALTAGGGAEGLEIYKKHKDEIQLVITDLMMPGMDGPEAIRGLQGINPTVKIVASSGLVSSAYSAEAEAAGVHRFLHKPYAAKALLEMVRSTLQDERCRP